MSNMSSKPGRQVILQRLLDSNVREKLMAIEGNVDYLTSESSYTSNQAQYPDGRIPFVDKHMDYLLMHPNVNPEQYLSNLRLMHSKRQR